MQVEEEKSKSSTLEGQYLVLYSKIQEHIKQDIFDTNVMDVPMPGRQIGKIIYIFGDLFDKIMA